MTNCVVLLPLLLNYDSISPSEEKDETIEGGEKFMQIPGDF